MSTYERQRQLNIERNKQVLESLGLDKPFFEPKDKPAKPKPPPTKRKSEVESEQAPTSKVRRVESIDGIDTVRRSSRHIREVINDAAEQQPSGPVPLSCIADESGSCARESVQRVHDPKTFGSIPGIEVGTWWETRQLCSIDAIHAPWIAGISGSNQEGAYSVALSGGYDDDVDLGYAFTYTGSGGRDLKGTKKAPKNLRTAPQSSDQTFENPFNKILLQSSKTKKPVRVIRGFKLKSPYAPSEGYRYDGLYKVEKAWMEKGLNPKGYLVCKFAFKRLPGQPPLLERDAEEVQDPQGI